MGYMGRFPEFILQMARPFIRANFFISLLLLHVSLFPVVSKPQTKAEKQVFGPVSPENYVIGDFDPAKHPLFVNVGSLGIPVSRDHYLREEAAMALQKMYVAFKKAHPGVEFRVISSTRNWHHQNLIWTRKWTGKTRVEGDDLSRSKGDPLKRATKILEYSSMPGTSRHHWGTDFDLNNLNNRYFDSGDGKVLFVWLERHADEYGFCRPYTEGRSQGYNPERWHWSYRPLAVKLLKKWNEVIARNPHKITLPGKFPGSKVGQEIASIYVNGISSSCKMVE